MSSPGIAAQLRIAVLDDNSEVRDALKLRLAKDARVEAVGCAAASNAVAVTDVIQELQPNVVLLDPGDGGMHTTAIRSLLALRRDGACLVALHAVRPEGIGGGAALATVFDLYIPKGMRTSALLDLLMEAPARGTTSDPRSWSDTLT